MASWKKILLIGGVAIFLIVLIYANIKKGSEDTIPVQVEKVKRGTITHVVSGTGKIQPEVNVKISANVAARIIQLKADEGNRVHRGQILVELDRRRYEAAVTQARAVLSSAKASLRQAEASLKNSKRALGRTQKLFKKGLTSEEQLDQTKTQFEVQRSTFDAAKDRVVQANAQLQQAEDDLSKTTIRSPIDGVVIQRNKEVGEIALGSQFQEDVILKVADLSRMEVQTEIDENDVVDVATGDTARISIDAFPDTTFNGIVTEIAHTAIVRGRGTQEEVTNFQVKISVLNTIPKLRPGMSATVDIETETHKNVLVIPIQAVTVRDISQIPSLKKKAKKDTSRVFGKEEKGAIKKVHEVVFVVKDGTAHIRPVKTGISSDTDIEILEGIKEGEKIVTGSFRALSKDLRDGRHVRIEKKRKYKSE